MTNLQLLLSIGVPSLLIVLSWVTNNQRLSRLEAGLDATNRRLDDLRADTHMDALEILRSMTALHERVAVVEAKQS